MPFRLTAMQRFLLLFGVIIFGAMVWSAAMALSVQPLTPHHLAAY